MSKKKKIVLILVLICTIIIDAWVILSHAGNNPGERLLIVSLVTLAGALLILNCPVLFDVMDNLVHDRKLIFSLSKSDFKTNFAGSFFGIIWAYVQPIIMLLVYWFALEIGIRSARVSEYPFVLWLMSGLVPWFFFSEALSSGTNALTEYSYLVKKVVFKINILPTIKVVSAIYVHLVFVAFIVIFHMFYGYYPDWYSLQLIYYIFAMFVLVSGLTYLTSAVVVFFKDLNQIINIILQVGIWATPIMWNIADYYPKLDKIMKLNPLYYVINGFRDSLLVKVWFWDRPLWTAIFWVITIGIYILGRNVFKKLQVHFADVM